MFSHLKSSTNAFYINHWLFLIQGCRCSYIQAATTCCPSPPIGGKSESRSSFLSVSYLLFFQPKSSPTPRTRRYISPVASWQDVWRLWSLSQQMSSRRTCSYTQIALVACELQSFTYTWWVYGPKVADSVKNS